MNEAAQRLKAEVALLPDLSTGKGHASERTWHEHVNEIQRLVLEDDPAQFLAWPPIVSTMAARGHEDWSSISCQFLQTLLDWETRWKPAIVEVPVGNPAYHGELPPTSNALVTAAHCLALFEQKMSVRVSDLELVFEFGGGYGCMCRLLYSLGFAGEYIDYDLPVVAALAQYYLSEVGLFEEKYISCISNLGTSTSTRVFSAIWERSLFLSTWALSEVPLSLRRHILSLTRQFKYFYLVYQPEFREVDNTQFFDEMISVFPDVHWQKWEIEHLGAMALAGMRQ